MLTLRILPPHPFCRRVKNKIKTDNKNHRRQRRQKGDTHVTKVSGRDNKPNFLLLPPVCFTDGEQKSFRRKLQKLQRRAKGLRGKQSLKKNQGKFIQVQTSTPIILGCYQTSLWKHPHLPSTTTLNPPTPAAARFPSVSFGLVVLLLTNKQNASNRKVYIRL